MGGVGRLGPGTFDSMTSRQLDFLPLFLHPPPLSPQVLGSHRGRGDRRLPRHRPGRRRRRAQVGQEDSTLVPVCVLCFPRFKDALFSPSGGCLKHHGKGIRVCFLKKK